MTRLSVSLLLLGLLCLSPILLSTVRAEDADNDDIVDEDDGSIDDDGDLTATGRDVDEEEESGAMSPSPDAEVVLLFTKPSRTKQFPAGAIVKFLVSFYNKGDKDFTVTEMDASFRYPQDYSFFIQNYTSAKFNRVVEAGHETTLDYAFVASENYAGRPLGLSILVRYMDQAGKVYQNAVFNETVNIVDDESAFNPETGFLYIVLSAIIVLLMLLGRQFMSKMRKRHGLGGGSRGHTKTSAPIETGTSNKADIDFEWIPRQVQEMANRSPGRSPPSARHRRNKASKADE